MWQLLALAGVYLLREDNTEPDREPVENSDESLVANWRQGDPGAFETLVRRYQNQAYSTCRRYLINPETAEETTQDVFITLFQKLGTFRGDSSFKSWFFRVLVNHCHNRHKTDRRRRTHTREAFDFAQTGGRPAFPSQRQSDPETAYFAMQRQKLVSQALENVSEESRLVLLLRENRGLSYEEVANALDLSIGTVKSRIHRARSELKTEVTRLINPTGENTDAV